MWSTTRGVHSFSTPSISPLTWANVGFLHSIHTPYYDNERENNNLMFFGGVHSCHHRPRSER